MAWTKLGIGVLVVALTVGCQDENSPDMGAVPPKPRPEVLQQLPESARNQMQGAAERERAAASEMGSRMPGAAQAGSNR